MWVESEKKLRVARRRMLNRIIGHKRWPEESWVEFIQRTTHRSEDLAKQHKLEDWVELQRRRKWEFAGKVARLPRERWCLRLLGWRPWFRCHPRRRVGRPLKRWSDDLVAFAGGDWQNTARDEGMWKILNYGFVDCKY